MCLCIFKESVPQPSVDLKRKKKQNTNPKSQFTRAPIQISQRAARFSRATLCPEDIFCSMGAEHFRNADHFTEVLKLFDGVQIMPVSLGLLPQTLWCCVEAVGKPCLHSCSSCKATYDEPHHTDTGLLQHVGQVTAGMPAVCISLQQQRQGFQQLQDLLRTLALTQLFLPPPPPFFSSANFQNHSRGKPPLVTGTQRENSSVPIKRLQRQGFSSLSAGLTSNPFSSSYQMFR